MTDITTEARAEAEKRYPDSNQNDNRITYPVGALIADFRRAFEKGAEWAASRSQEPRCEHGIDRPKFTLTGSDGAVYEFIVCAGCGCLISYTDQHPCHDGEGPR